MATDPSEELTVRAFVHPDRVERWLTKLANAKQRSQALDRISAEHDWDTRWYVDVSATGGREALVDRIDTLLRERGAPDECRVMSPTASLDGRTMPLREALESVVGRKAALVICVPGTLAYWEGEPPSLRQILHRP